MSVRDLQASLNRIEVLLKAILDRLPANEDRDLKVPVPDKPMPEKLGELMNLMSLMGKMK